MCSDGWDFIREGDKINGICPECGEETSDGAAPRGCNYSPVICKTCGDSPCDQSC